MPIAQAAAFLAPLAHGIRPTQLIRSAPHRTSMNYNLITLPTRANQLPLPRDCEALGESTRQFGTRHGTTEARRFGALRDATHPHRKSTTNDAEPTWLWLWLWASCCLTKKLSSSQPTTSPYRRTLSRVCSNAWFGMPWFLRDGGSKED